ncbi:hypothetical protein [Paenibacillus macquariensis]|uniref:Uncharacterized protein n=1 Tax=Paenibacillus macquariensis TaxID=948756 RepID=A0ABY1JXC1_9BACL|nr:hypothetical protein [Paenibacillus macquariensis]MEC0089353.1 hypothetical protein [Paenibacillus macquariensis]OAB33249.1 hypothetical protein PMSM_14640 [Paenibacillus macquariensis subsp. macquariensis]SIQ93185.1 hypothetical protein SAMN05421578_105105 [Paenibacillus macquariensis]
MCKCLQELASQHSKSSHQNRRDAEVQTNVNINIIIRPYIFDDIKGARLSKTVIYKDIPPKFCPICGKKVRGYQEANSAGSRA